MTLLCLHFVVLVASLLACVSGHGRLLEPPSRSSMWRFGFKTKPNYNDNELFCGGYTVHWQRNGGKCGVCGDAWNLASPRPNEAGGIYARGIIVRKYKPGEIIKSTVELTANHRGYFEFKLCPHNDPKTEVTQDCLDQHILELADGSGTKYYPTGGTGAYNVQLRIPSDVTCTQCVFQWTYTAGNNWGTCVNGTSKVGCGPQETFRGCADVAVDNNDDNDIPTYEKPSIPTRRTTRRPKTTWRPRYRTTRRPYSRRPRPYHWRTTTTTTTRRPYVYTRPYRPSKPVTYGRFFTPRPTPHRPIPTRRYTKPRPTQKTKYYTPNTNNINLEREIEVVSTNCRAVGVWKTISGIASWCDSNCARGYCPSSHCDCS